LKNLKNKQTNKQTNKTMKNKIAIASAFLAAANFSTAEIVINDFLSFEGFVDMSYTHTDTETAGSADDNESSFGLDQVEISWLFDFDAVTAQIDLQHEGDREVDTDSEVEQAFVTYHFADGGAITAGRYASMLGFEAFEPTGLYQFSFAYDDLSILPSYAQGVKYTYATDTTFFGISLQDTVFDDIDGINQLGGNSSESSHGVEVAGSINMENGITFFLGGAYEDGEVDDTYVINAYTTYETGAWLFAAEVNFGNSKDGDFGGAAAGTDVDAFSALVMANLAYSEQASVTGRLSYVDFDGDAASDQHAVKYTAAHNYAFTDNLLLVTEVSFADGSAVGTDFEELSAAVELLFTF
jgi:hypothetical protein